MKSDMVLTAKGFVCDKALKPKKLVNAKTGKLISMKLGLRCEDRIKPKQFVDSIGEERWPCEFIKVILANHLEKQFEFLAPGRKIQVIGGLTNNANEGYANYVLFAEEIVFLDVPIKNQLNRITDMMVESGMEINGKKVTKEECTSMRKQFHQYTTALRGDKGPLREYYDNAPQAQSTESKDPDQPDF